MVSMSFDIFPPGRNNTAQTLASEGRAVKRAGGRVELVLYAG